MDYQNWVNICDPACLLWTSKWILFVFVSFSHFSAPFSRKFWPVFIYYTLLFISCVSICPLCLAYAKQRVLDITYIIQHHLGKLFVFSNGSDLSQTFQGWYQAHNVWIHKCQCMRWQLWKRQDTINHFHPLDNSQLVVRNVVNLNMLLLQLDFIFAHFHLFWDQALALFNSIVTAVTNEILFWASFLALKLYFLT